MKKLLLCVYLLLASAFYSCKKESNNLSATQIQNTGSNSSTTTTSPIDTTSIIGKWSMITDSVATQGYYTVGGYTPITGKLKMYAGDYLEFTSVGSLNEVWYGQPYPYPCTYKIVSDSILITNNAYAPLDTAKIRMTGHTLTITGKNSTSSGSIVSVFYLTR